MAHQLYGTMETKQGKTGKKLYFLRKDIEASDVEKNILTQIPINSTVKDWDDILSKTDDIVLAFSWRMNKIANKFKVTKKGTQNWYVDNDGKLKELP